MPQHAGDEIAGEAWEDRVPDESGVVPGACAAIPPDGFCIEESKVVTLGLCSPVNPDREMPERNGDGGNGV